MSSTFVRKFEEAKLISKNDDSLGIKKLQNESKIIRRRQIQSWNNYQLLRNKVHSDFSGNKLLKLQSKVLRAVRNGGQTLCCRCYRFDGYYNSSLFRMISGKYYFYHDFKMFHDHLDEIIENLNIFGKIRSVIPIESLEIKVERNLGSYCILLHF